MRWSLVAAVATVVAAVSIVPVYAQGVGTGGIGGVGATILGLHPIIAALGITIIAIGLRTIFGMAGKSRKDFDIILLLRSAAVGFFAAITMVATSLGHIPVGATDLAILTIVTTQIAGVMGIDAGVHSVSKRVKAHVSGGKGKVVPVAPDEGDDESDITPEEEGEELPPPKE